MSNNPKPYFPFYVSDHYRIGIFGRCSIEATGLYVRLLSIAWDSPRCGYLLDSTGKPIPDTPLAKNCAVTDQQFLAGIEELLQLGAVQRLTDKTLRVTLMLPEAFSVTLRKRELIRERVARHRYRKKALDSCNAVTRYTDIDSDIDSENKAVVVSAVVGKSNKNAQREQELFKNSITDADIELIISAFPKSGNRKRTVAAIKSALAKISYAELQRAVENYADENSGTNPNFLKSPEKWMSDGLWRDYCGERWERRQKAVIEKERIAAARRTGKLVPAPDFDDDDAIKAIFNDWPPRYNEELEPHEEAQVVFGDMGAEATAKIVALREKENRTDKKKISEIVLAKRKRWCMKRAKEKGIIFLEEAVKTGYENGT